MSVAKPYRSVVIQECGEALIAIPEGLFDLFTPHPYVAFGAPYGTASPWMLRSSILKSLQKAQEKLQTDYPRWKIKLFDAYRPNAVQSFMVARELTMLAKAEGLEVPLLTASQREELMVKVFKIWGIPSDDPQTPPPHSTGAVFDCTLVDENGTEVEMGSPIDENSDRSHPNYFAYATDKAGKDAHKFRQLLNGVLEAEGFCRHASEWWHFSRGDQLAVWLGRETEGAPQIAIYGRADLLSPS